MSFLLSSEDFGRVLEQFVQKHALAVKELTEKQLAEAFRQALVCGDFIKQVRIYDNGQTVVYLPYSTEQALRFEIEQLKKEIQERVDDDRGDAIEKDLNT